YRHLARTKAVDTDLAPEVDEARISFSIEIRRRNADLEFVFQSLGEGFCDLHSVNLLPAWSGVKRRNIVNLVDAQPLKAGVSGSAARSFRVTWPFGNRSASNR